MTENEQKQIEAIVELLSDTEFSLESFNMEPELDEDGNVSRLIFTLESDLFDLREGQDSALTVIEDHFIGEQNTFKEVLEKITVSEEDEE